MGDRIVKWAYYIPLLLVVSCGGTATQTRSDAGQDAEAEDVNWDALAAQCMELLNGYERTDLAEAGEAELSRQMQESAANVDVCSRAITAVYDGPGGQIMASHLAGGLALHSLQAELALSYRFDELEGYCAILEELIETLGQEVQELNEFIESGEPNEEDVRHLGPLLELSVQSLQISLLDYTDTCR